MYEEVDVGAWRFVKFREYPSGIGAEYCKFFPLFSQL
jgi:hypothetical protein